jgi:gliding motility-associated-like protein
LGAGSKIIVYMGMKLFCVLFAAIFSMHGLFASHIVGGEILYKYTGKNNSLSQYKVSLWIYIDCDNGEPGAVQGDAWSSLNVHSYHEKTDSYSLYNNNGQFYPLMNAYKGRVSISGANYNCIRIKPSVCVDKYIYEVDIEVPDNEGGYIVSFGRCCRNNTINNIIAPGSTGSAFWTRIPGTPKIQVNSSPVFKYLPPNFLCLNTPLKFDHSAVDEDGDSLTYELFTPFTAGDWNNSAPAFNSAVNPADFSLVNWNGYSIFNQIDGAPSLSIDGHTGKLTLTPTKAGQFVVGIKVNEYRKGVKIGETKRDFQFNVSNCVLDVVSNFSVPKINCVANLINFVNKSENGTGYLWNFGDPNNAADSSSLKNPSYTYRKAGDYTVKLTTTNSKCTDVYEYKITVKKNFSVKIPADTLVCGSFTKMLYSNVRDKTYKWSTGESTPVIHVNKGGTYWVNVTDAPCVSSDTIYIINDLSTVELGPDSVICRDSFVRFSWEGKPGYASYYWNDGTNEQSVFIPVPGRYWLHAINRNNCPSVDSINFVLYPPPKVSIHDTLVCEGANVKLDGINQDLNNREETKYLWNTGAITPHINIFNAGMYHVRLQNKLCQVFDTATISYIQSGLDLGPDTFYCGPVDRWIKPQRGFVRYRWDDGSSLMDHHISHPGVQKITIMTKEGCVDSDSVIISQLPLLYGGLIRDTTICRSSGLELTAADSMVSYLWNTGADTRSIFASDSGYYIVTIKARNGCIVNDTVHIGERADALPVELFMPNAFSPNGDYLNEVYPGNHYKDPGSPYLLRIYNRWGEQIFESDRPSVQWDGTSKGAMAAEDVYLYSVRYVGCDDVERRFRGTFTLIK